MSFDTDPSKPVVVDSPIETADPNAIEPVPVEDILEPVQEESYDGRGESILDELDPVETAKDPAAKVSTDAEKIAAIGQSVGVDLSRFPTVEAAQAAADMVYERFATLGGDGDIASVLKPDKADDEVVDESDDLGLDEATTDPNILAAFKKLNGKNTELRKSLAEKAKNDRVQQTQNIVNGIQAQAEGFLDGLNGADFGKTGKRTVAQAAKAEVVHKIATKAVAGLIQESRRTNTNPNLSMNDIMGWAVKQAGFTAEKKQAAAAPAKKAFALPPKSPTGGGASSAGQATMPRVSQANDPNNIFNSNDPTINAIWIETLRRVNR